MQMNGQSTNRFARVIRGLAATLVLLAAFPVMSAAAERSVVIVIEPWAPFADPGLERDGFLSALTRAAFAAAGYETRIEFLPWARALLEVKQGDRQVLMGAYYTPERAEVYWYSDPVYETRVGFIALDDFPVDSYDELRDLEGHTIGTGRGFANSEAFDSADYLDKEIVKDQVLNLRKLYNGRVDMVTGSFDRVPFTAREEGHDISRLKYIEPPLKTHTIHVGISRALDDGERIRDDFNRGLERIRANGTYQSILDAVGPGS